MASLSPTKIADSVIRLFPQKSRGIHSLHPAIFPVTLPAELIKSFACDGHIIFDPFAGSGSTMLASDKAGLICYSAEISPTYCDLILARMETVRGVVCTRISP